MLIGQYFSKLTDKERISVPKKFRVELGENLIIARWYEECLVLVSVDGWEKLLERLGGISGKVTTPIRDVDRFILGSAYEINLDKQGRFIVPDLLKTYSGIIGDVTFVGLGDRVEVWASDRWKLIEENVRVKAEEAIERIAKDNK